MEYSGRALMNLFGFLEAQLASLVDGFEHVLSDFGLVDNIENRPEFFPVCQRNFENHFQWIRGKISPQSIHTGFVHAKHSSTRELLQHLYALRRECSNFVFDIWMIEPRITGFADFSRNLLSFSRQIINWVQLEKFFIYFLFTAVVVVFFLFQYLMGYIERGGWATYSDTSWEFRAAYVSIELRLAAYFWFKFRARAGPGIPSVSPNKRSKFEPKLKAKLQSGENAKDVWLGEYDTYEEASQAYWMGAFYYERWDRFSAEGLSWWRTHANLPPLSPNQSDKDKALWVRNIIKAYLTRRHQGQGAVAEEQNQAAGCAAPVISGIGERGSRNPTGATQPASCEEVIPVESSAHIFMAESSNFSFGIPLNSDIDDSGLHAWMKSLEHDLASSEDDLGPTDLTRTGQGHHCDDLAFGDQGAASDVQHFQQNRGSATVLEGGGARAILGQHNESEEHHVLMASANHPQAVDQQVVTKELKIFEFTDSIQSTLRHLIELGWDFEIQPRVSTEFSVVFTRLTAADFLAYQEIHEQGFQLILKPLSNASTQDGNGSPQRRKRSSDSSEARMWRPQSRSGSQDLCRNCKARLCPK